MNLSALSRWPSSRALSAMAFKRAARFRNGFWSVILECQRLIPRKGCVFPGVLLPKRHPELVSTTRSRPRASPAGAGHGDGVHRAKWDPLVLRIPPTFPCGRRFAPRSSFDLRSLKELHRRGFFLWEILILGDFLGPRLRLNIWLLRWNVRLLSLGLGYHDDSFAE